MKAYDREGFNGKLRYEELTKPISFHIRAANKPDMGLKVLEAMAKEDDVWLHIYLVRDVYDTPIRAVLVNIEVDDPDPLT